MSTYGLDDIRWFNNVSGAMLGYSSAFGMSVMEGREGAANTDIRRYMTATRRKAYKALSELLEHAGSDWASRGARRIRKKSYAKVFRASVRAETSRLPVCGSAARRNRRLG